MNKLKLIALGFAFVALQRIPAQDVIFRAQTRLVVVDVNVKDKNGAPVPNLTAADFEVTEDGKKQNISQFEFEKLTNDALAAIPAETSPTQLVERAKPAPAKPAPAAAPKAEAPKNGTNGTGETESTQPGASARKDKRLLAMFFDQSTMQQFDQIRAQENAAKFIREQMTSSDMIEIMTYGNKLTVVEDFTNDRERLLAAVKKLVVGEGSGLAGGTDSAAEGDDSGGFTQDDSEFSLFNTDRELAALEDAIKKLAAFPEKKGLLYFSGGISKSGISNQAQLKSTEAAANRANVSIYAMDVRGLQAEAPGGDASTASPRGTSMFTGSGQQGRRDSRNDTQETLATLAADTGGKFLLDDNDLTVGMQQAQADMSSYYILAYYSSNSADDGKYRHISVRVTNAQVASNLKPLDYRNGYYANKQFQKFTSADKEQQLQEALTLGDPVNDLPIVLEPDYFRVANNRYFVPISVKIPGSEIGLKKANGLNTTDFDFVTQVLDSKGKTPQNLPNWVTLGVKDQIPVKLKDADAALLEKRSFQYNTGLTLPPGDFVIRFLARENQSGKMGLFETKFTIPDLALEKSLKLSSVVFSSQKDAVTAAVGTAGNDKRTTANDPLVENNQRIVPSVTNVFRHDQMLYVHFEVYDPAMDATAKTPSLAAEMDLFQGARKVYTSPPVNVNKVITTRPGVAPFNFTVPLDKLPSGRFTAQITVIDETGHKFAFKRGQIAILPDAAPAQKAAN
jgi:VWFA-related protein